MLYWGEICTFRDRSESKEQLYVIFLLFFAKPIATAPGTHEDCVVRHLDAERADLVERLLPTREEAGARVRPRAARPRAARPLHAQLANDGAEERLQRARRTVRQQQLDSLCRQPQCRLAFRRELPVHDDRRIAAVQHVGVVDATCVGHSVTITLILTFYLFWYYLSTFYFDVFIFWL